MRKESVQQSMQLCSELEAFDIYCQKAAIALVIQWQWCVPVMVTFDDVPAVYADLVVVAASATQKKVFVCEVSKLVNPRRNRLRYS